MRRHQQLVLEPNVAGCSAAGGLPAGGGSRELCGPRMPEGLALNAKRPRDGPTVPQRVCTPHFADGLWQGH